MGGLTTNFVYDADGKRIKKAETNGSSITTTLYVGNYYEQVLVNGVLSETVKYYYTGSNPSSGRTMRRTPTVGQENLSYIFADHLGSTSVVSSTVGGQVDRISFLPFGGTRSGSVPTDNKFTGQKLDSYIKLYEMGATIQTDPFSTGLVWRFSWTHASPMAAQSAPKFDRPPRVGYNFFDDC